MDLFEFIELCLQVSDETLIEIEETLDNLEKNPVVPLLIPQTDYTFAEPFPL